MLTKILRNVCFVASCLLFLVALYEAWKGQYDRATFDMLLSIYLKLSAPITGEITGELVWGTD